MEDTSFVERVTRANNENDRSGSVGTATIKIVNSKITATKNPDIEKNTYTKAKIRSAAIVQNTQTNSLVLSAYLGAGYVGTDAMSCGNVTISGTWGTSSGDLQIDTDVQD